MIVPYIEHGFNGVVKSASVSVFSSIASYATTIYLARNLNSSDFGSLVYLLSIALIVIQLADLAFEQCAADYSVKFRVETRQLWAKFLLPKLTSACILIIVSPFLATNIGNPWALLLLAVPILYMAPVFEVRGKNLAYACIKLIERLTIFSLIAFLINLNFPYERLFLAYGIGYLVCLIMQLWFARPDSAFPEASDSSFTYAAYFGAYWPVYITLICHLVFGQISRLFAENAFGVSYFAAIYLALQIVNVFSVFQVQLERHFRPRLLVSLRSQDVGEVISVYKGYLLIGLVPAVFFSGALLIFAEQIVALLFGDGWDLAPSLVKVLALLPVSVCTLRLIEISGLPAELTKFNLGATVMTAGALMMFLSFVTLHNPLSFPAAILISHVSLTVLTGARLLWWLSGRRSIAGIADA